MLEKHCAYKIVKDPSGVICSKSEITEDKMVDLLTQIRNSSFTGLYWVFKQINDTPQEALCVIDCQQQRIYFHYSGEVGSLDNTIKKLTS